MTVDHPFLFAITDTATGLPLFLGQVTDPRPADPARRGGRRARSRSRTDTRTGLPSKPNSSRSRRSTNRR